MPSQFFGLNIAYTGLVSAQAAINTTGNNISNVETKGYSRQEAIQKAAEALRTNTTYGMAGAGVVTTSIEQIRNAYYDTKYWNNNADLGQYNIKQYYMKQIEDYFTESDTVDGFTAIYDDFYSALSEVQKSAGDESVRAQFISFAGNLATYFNEMSTDLTKLQEDTNAEIKNKADEINSIAAQVANLNKQINVIEINGVTANELRDQRAMLIDQLSTIVDVEVVETPIYTSESGEQLSGANRYNVYIAGQQLVDCYDYTNLVCVARDNKVNQSDAEGLYDLYWNDSNGLEFNLYGKNLGGELKGLIEIRDGNNEEYFKGTIQATTANTVTIEVTDSYLTDMNKSTLSATGVISLNSREYDYTGWTYDEATKAYTFNIDVGTAPPLAGLVGEVSAIGTAVDYQGVPYYQQQLNEWVRTFAQTVNEIEISNGEGTDLYGDKLTRSGTGGLFFAENVVNNDVPYIFGDYTPGMTTTTSTGDTYYQLTASNFTVSYSMVKDSGKLATTTNSANGEDAYDLVTELLAVKDDKDKMSFRGCSSAEFLQSITSDIALNANSANTFQANFKNISNAISNQRLSISGVDNDEEALNLVKFQNAFNLASKMVQVMTEIYDRLILNTGV